MAKLSKRSAIAIKQETTQGASASPAATDYILGEGMTIDVVTEKLTRDFARPWLDPIPQMIGKRSCEIKFKSELKGITMSSSAWPGFRAALEACGLTGGAMADAGVTFFPSSSAASANFSGPGKSATIRVWRDGIQHDVAGCLGTFKTSLEAGKIAYFEFDFKGNYVTEPYDAAQPTVTPDLSLPPIVQLAQLNMHSFQPVATKLDFDAGVVVTERDDVSSANGILGFQITDVAAKGNVDPEAPTVASHNVFNALINGTTGSMSAVVGAVAGDIIEFYFPCVQYNDVKYADRSGLLTMAIPLTINSVTGNDSFRITFR